LKEKLKEKYVVMLWLGQHILPFLCPPYFLPPPYFLLPPLPLSATQYISPLVAVDDLHAFMVGDLAWSF